MTKTSVHRQTIDQSRPLYWSGVASYDVTVTDNPNKAEKVKWSSSPTSTQETTNKLFVDVRSLGRDRLREILGFVPRCERFRVRLSQPLEPHTFIGFARALVVKELEIEDVAGVLTVEDLEDIATLPALRVFVMQNPRPTGFLLEPLLRANRLESLSVGAEVAATIEQIAEMTALRDFSVVLTPRTAEQALSVIGRMSQLKSLSLSFSAGQEFDDSVSQTNLSASSANLEPLCGLFALQTITLSNFMLSESDVTALSSLKQLSSLSLYLCDHTFFHVLAAYAKWPALRELRIHFTFFSPYEWESLSQFPQLETFFWLGMAVPKEMAAMLVRVKKLKKVEIVGVGLTRKEKKDFLRFLKGVEVVLHVTPVMPLFWYIAPPFLGLLMAFCLQAFFSAEFDIDLFSVLFLVSALFFYFVGWAINKCERWLDEREEKK